MSYNRFSYVAYSREVVNEISKSRDKDMLYKFIKSMCKYSKETKDFNVPIVKENKIKERK